MLRKHNFIPGEYYHIYNRGIDKRSIFKSKFDYERFIMLLKVANSVDSFRLDQLINYQHKNFEEILSIDTGDKLVSLGAWCLMTNHFHLLIREEKENGISQFMKKLGTGFSMYFNIKYARAGGLFGGPFKSKLISEDSHMKHLFGYIHLNPLDIKFSDWQNSINEKHPLEWNNFLKDYRYSSYHDYMGKDRIERNVLNTKVFPDYFSDHNSFQDFIDSYLCLKE